MPTELPATLCVFVKSPTVGLVKTRLAASVGLEAAARLARAFIIDTVALARRSNRGRVVIALSGSRDELPHGIENLPIWEQGDGDLGARLERCLRKALTETPMALVIGTDSPGLPLVAIEDACTLLECHDAVVGPADDGGFYLLGLKACPAGILDGIPWSTDATCAQTLSRLCQLGLSVGLLGRWFDVDLVQDLERLRGLLASGQVRADATSEVLGVGASEGASLHLRS